MPKYKGAIKDAATGEWFFNGKWYDHYPHEEIEKYNAELDEYYERKHDERKERKS